MGVHLLIGRLRLLVGGLVGLLVGLLSLIGVIALAGAVGLLRLGLVDLKPLATDIFPLEDWEKAFQMFREKKGLKLIFQPKDE